MKLAVRLIYYMPGPAPSCDIVELTQEQWYDFYFHTKDSIERRDWMIRFLGREKLFGRVRELCWIPLDHQSKLVVREE